MPTVHVTPESGDLLQEVANCLWKSRKVVVVTGAGISTNSGIPDFRSENGLYSLIQAQFEAAATQPQETSELDPDASSASSFSDECRPAKRRKIYGDDSEIHVATDSATRDDEDLSIAVAPQRQIQARSTEESQSPETRPFQDAPDHTMADAPNDTVEVKTTTVYCADSIMSEPSCLPLHEIESKHGDDATLSIHVAQDEGLKTASTTPQRFAQSTPTLRRLQVPFCSSPLSSPPPILFDPYEESPTDTASSSSSSSSETDETPPSSDPFASQSSIGSRSSLPNLKGRDLFDVSIWADPMKTSVFYTFATTLRQKVRAVRPTTSHHFIGHLRDRGKLVRCYTQNIDEIEEKVGLSTSLGLGPGHRGRFSTRSASRASLGSEAKDAQTGSAPKPVVRDTRDPGVECVFLHGSLHSLRCFLCGEICNWDEADRETETLSGRQPSCPRCEGATAARQERGKRALGVGKLRPDIVLYGEEHPNAHLISPIVQHDISLAPDLMLILGTSLRVHGLKVLVKEFAKAIHRRGGKVVFVNFTKPPESVWSDIIDYWIQWDCDAWVHNLKERQPALWLPPEECPPKLVRTKSKTKAKPKPRRATEGVLPTQLVSDHEEKVVKREPSEEPKSEAKRPVSIRDNKANGAFLVCKIMEDLAKASEDLKPVAMPHEPTRASARRRKPRQSAPAMLEGRRTSMTEEAIVVQTTEEQQDSVVEQAPVSPRAPSPPPGADSSREQTVSTPDEHSAATIEIGSILDAVKSNPRKRKRKIIDGVEVLLPKQQARPQTKASPKTTASEKPVVQMPIVSEPRPVASAAVLSVISPVAPSMAMSAALSVTPSATPSATPSTTPPVVPGWQRTDALIADLSRQATPLPGFDQNLAMMALPRPRPILKRVSSGRKSAIPRIPALRPSGHPLTAVKRPAPLEPPTNTGPLNVISTNLRYPECSRSLMIDPFFLTDPMVTRLQRPPALLKPENRAPEWNPTTQLINDSERATEAAMTLSLLRNM